MSESIDHLLAQVKAEFQDHESPKAPSAPVPPSSHSPRATMNQSQSSSSPIDQLLSEVKAEFQDAPTPKPKSAPASPIQADLKQVRSPRPRPSVSSNSSTSTSSVTGGNDPMLKDLKQELLQEEQAKVAEAKRQEQLKQQRKQQALQTRAQEWLKNLDPHSDEGLWFEEFSYGYDSRLKAAMDYLDALREVRLLS